MSVCNVTICVTNELFFSDSSAQQWTDGYSWNHVVLWWKIIKTILTILLFDCSDYRSNQISALGVVESRRDRLPMSPYIVPVHAITQGVSPHVITKLNE